MQEDGVFVYSICAHLRHLRMGLGAESLALAHAYTSTPLHLSDRIGRPRAPRLLHMDVRMGRSAWMRASSPSPFIPRDRAARDPEAMKAPL